MTFDQAIFGVLSTNAGVAAIVGGSPSWKIFPVGLQTAKLPPYIVFSRTKNQDYRTIDGALPTIEGMTVEVICYASTPAAVDALSDAVQNALLPCKGEVAGAPGFYWCMVLHGSISDIYEAEEMLYAVNLTFETIYRT